MALQVTSRGSKLACQRPKCVCAVTYRRFKLHVRATAQPEPETRTAPVQPLASSVKQSYDKFVARYEQSLLSSGVGALCVTTWCVAHGQPPQTAAAVTVAATVMALVLNETLFSDDISS